MVPDERAWWARLDENRVCAALLSVGVLASGAILVAFSNGLYFVGDSWDFLLHRGTIDGADRGLLSPHNEHWSTLPILVFRGMFAVFGLEHFLPYVLLMIVTHMLLCVLVYVVLTSLGSARWPALLATLLLAFFGGGYENTMWEFQIGFVGALVLGMGAIAVLHRWSDSALALVVANVLLVLGVMCSGTGICAVILVVTYVAFTKGVRASTAVGATPTVVYLAWFAAYGADAQTHITNPGTLLDVPAYVWMGFTAGLERFSGIPGSGGLLLVVLLAAPFVVRDIAPHLRALACAGVVAAIAQMLLQGVARIELGIPQANASRYAYLILVLLAPAIAVTLTAVSRAIRAPRLMGGVMACLLAALYVAHGMAAQHTFREVRLATSPDLERLMAAIQVVVPAGGPVLTEAPFPPYNLDVTVSVLDTPQARAALAGQEPSARTALDGESLVYVGVGTESFGLDPAASIETEPELSADDVDSGDCGTLVVPPGGATISFDSPAAGAQISVTGPATLVTTSLERDGVRSVETPHTVAAGAPVVVGVRAPGAMLRATFNEAGNYRVCPATGVVR
jgi:hypothetical protein